MHTFQFSYHPSFVNILVWRKARKILKEFPRTLATMHGIRTSLTIALDLPIGMDMGLGEKKCEGKHHQTFTHARFITSEYKTRCNLQFSRAHPVFREAFTCKNGNYIFLLSMKNSL